ncbi:hypothetical protein IKF15_00260 [Candidatus Saccharibacteria bacterium]|nr:hypothetical protein [Candidatus Saccharibacteria bacterium]
MRAYCAKLITNFDKELYIVQFKSENYGITSCQYYGEEMYFPRKKDAEEALREYTRDVKQEHINDLIDVEYGEFIARSEIETINY